MCALFHVSLETWHNMHPQKKRKWKIPNICRVKRGLDCGFVLGGGDGPKGTPRQSRHSSLPEHTPHLSFCALPPHTPPQSAPQSFAGLASGPTTGSTTVTGSGDWGGPRVVPVRGWQGVLAGPQNLN